MNHILLIGEQPSLLAARAKILAETGARITCCDMNQLRGVLWDRDFDLVILCYTLLESGVQRSCVISDVYRRWPRASVLQMVVGYGKQTAETGLDTSLMLGDPGELVQAAVRALGKRPPAEWLDFSEYTSITYAA
jgi:hypothetical protein